MTERSSDRRNNRIAQVSLLVSDAGEIVGLSGDSTLISQANLWGSRIDDLLDGTGVFINDMRETGLSSVNAKLRTAEHGRWLDAKGSLRNGQFQIEMSQVQSVETINVAPSPLPASVPSAANPESQREPRTRANLRAVLCVDDEEMILRVYRRMFPDSTKVFVARSVQEAIQLLKDNEEIDAILCDVMMPEACGYELFQHLTVTKPRLASRLAFISGGVFSRTLELAIEHSGAPIGEKPFSRADLDALICKVTERDARVVD